jgi:hypothetical protein
MLNTCNENVSHLVFKLWNAQIFRLLVLYAYKFGYQSRGEQRQRSRIQ